MPPKQLKLDLTPPSPPQPVSYLDLFHGLSDWFLTAEQPPIYMGWYRTRPLDGGEDEVRRFWDGETWSVATRGDVSDETSEDCRQTPMLSKYAKQVMWAGLLRAHIAGYTYPLLETERLGLAKTL